MPSENSAGQGKQGPYLNEQVQEVQGIFPSDAALQNAIGLLTRAGFDRAALSIPKSNPTQAEATPSAGAENPNTEDDTRQARTLQSSLAGAVGALAAAGATIATGGAAALAVAAAAGVGLAAGGAVSAVHTAAGSAQAEDRDSAARAGTLVLSAAIAAPGDEAKARSAMLEAGASSVAEVRRSGAGIA